MINAIIQGMGCGLLLSFMLGPVFFGLLHTSIHKGFNKAVMYAVGVASSDFFFIFITYFGIARFMQEESFKKIIIVIGAFIMIAFGLYYLFKKAPDTIEVNNEKKHKDKSNMWLKGFLLNAVNPSVFLFWIGMVSLASVKFSNDRILIYLFFATSILTVFGFDTLKAYIANKIKMYFTQKILNKMNKVLGIVILIAGLSLLYELVKGNL